MNIIRKVTLPIFIMLFVYSAVANADVNEESAFYDATKPASILDLKLAQIQHYWWEEFVNESTSTRLLKSYPLIAKAGMGINLQYSKDIIEASGGITNISGFLSLNNKERKKLLFEVLDALSLMLTSNTSLFDRKTGNYSLQYKKHIHVTILMNEIMEDTKGGSIRLLLPSGMGIGQAAYKDGEFLYSEPYYLNLQIKDGKAIAGDASKFVIEKE